MSADVNIMYEFYKTNSDFRQYVLKCAHQYGKTIHEVLSLATTYEVYLSLQKGGCNARD